MGVGAFLEPFTVVILLFGGAWINRSPDSFSATRSRRSASPDQDDDDLPELPLARQVESEDELDIEKRHISKAKRSLTPSLLPSQEQRWQERDIRIPILGFERVIQTPNTAVFRE